MNAEEKKIEMGKIGECLVRSICRGGAALSKSPFDYEKDIISNGRTLEIKTQIRYYKLDAFTIRMDQLKKCQNADFLVFVEYNMDNNKIRLWHCEDAKNGYETFTSKGARFAYDVSDLTLISILDWPMLAQKMRDISTSNYVQF